MKSLIRLNKQKRKAHIMNKKTCVDKTKYFTIFILSILISIFAGSKTVMANMEQSEIQRRLSSYSEWMEIENGVLQLTCPQEDVEEKDLFNYIKDISNLLKGTAGEDYCELDVYFEYSVSTYGTDMKVFYDTMFEMEERFCYYITNWSDLNNLNFKAGRYTLGGETSSYILLVELVQNGTKDYLNDYAYYNKLQEIVSEAQAQSTTEMELVYYFCKWLEENVVYDITLQNNSAYVAIMEQKALCGGYANALKDLCSLVGIETLVPTNDNLVHAWSEVRIDGVWYTIDLCNIVKPANGVFIMEYFMEIPDVTVDYTEFYNQIKYELDVPTPFLNTLGTLTLSKGTYDLDSKLRNVNSGAVVSYTSSDSSIATVDANGVITVVGKGSAVITVNVYTNGINYCLNQYIYSTYSSENATNTVTNSNSSIDGNKNIDNNNISKKIKNTRVKINKINNIKGKKVKITWKKVANAGGYQIRYATNKKFTKGRKNVNTNASATKKTIKKLKKKKTYYFKIRAYVKANGKKVYSKWSKVKKVKIKK